jgi:hypothetical protein
MVYLLGWDKSLSMCVLFIYYALWFLHSSFVELWVQSCVDLGLWYNLNNLYCVTLFVCLLGLLGILLNYISFGSWKWCACIFTLCTYYGMLPFIDPISRENSNKS